MTPQGPPPPGRGPGDPEDRWDRGGDEAPPGEPYEDGPEGTGPGTGQRGWLHPDDRLWRHPSELRLPQGGGGRAGAGEDGGAGEGVGAGPPGAGPPRAVPAGAAIVAPSRYRARVATVLAGSGAAAAVVALGLLLLLGASGGPGTLASTSGSSPSTALTVVTGCCSVVPTTERDARDALVSLTVATATSVDHVCGVVVGAGGLVATTLDALDGARSVTAVTASGTRLPAAVVAGDRTSDIALVRVPEDLPVARFSGDAAGASGHRAIVMAATWASGPGTALSTVTMWSAGTIRSVGATVSSGPAVGMAGIEAAAARPAMAGEVLLDHAGQVLGILDSTGTASGTRGTKVFLPAQLVVGVARALAAEGYVDHGWLDIEGTDAPVRPITTTSTSTAVTSRGAPGRTEAAGRVGGGAVVEAVEPGGASAGALRPGDVIRSIDGQPVRSMAQLRDRLYVLPPGHRVVLGVTSDGFSRSVAVVLSPSP